MLIFNKSWRFRSPGALEAEVVQHFFSLANKITGGDYRKYVFETFKREFSRAAGRPYNSSSNTRFAEIDLEAEMEKASENAPMFIEAFYEGCLTIERQHPDIPVPAIEDINLILSGLETGYEIDLPNLLVTGPHATVNVSERPKSLDEQIHAKIDRSLEQSQSFLQQAGMERHAVSEILWLLESFSTAFEGLETDAGMIQGEYFNKIARSLQSRHQGTSFEQILKWLLALHGYLSSPTGGGVRHGTSVKNWTDLQPNEARLYCNLIRSYIAYLMAEYDRIAQ